MQDHNMPAIVAHRGASGDAPENTLAAIRHAAKAGATWIEIDVNVSRDGVPVLHHDDDLRRCTNGTGLVIEHNLTELQKLDSGSWFHRDFAGEPVATLQQCLELCEELSLGINLEIKPCSGWEVPTTTSIAEVLKRNEYTFPLLISSFSYVALEEAAKLLAHIPRSALFLVAPPDWQSLTAHIDASNIHLHANSLLTAEAVESFHQHGLGVYCYTVNSTEQADDIFSRGVDGIFTNYPATLLQHKTR